MRALILAAAIAAAGAGPSWAAASLLEAVSAGERAEALKLVSGASANQADENGTTPLMWAAHNNDLELVRALIAAKAEVNARSAFGANAMREAATNGNTAIIRALLDAGADVDSASPEGMTALMIVARAGNVEAAELLLDRGAKIEAREELEHQNALMWAADARHAPMVRLLISKGANVNARSKVHEYDVRITAEPRVRYDPSGGFTPLMFAVREGCIDCAKALIAGGAKVNDYDPDGVTPLFLATWNGHFDMGAYLLTAGADVNRWDFWGRTALWGAVDYSELPRGGRSDRPSTDETTPTKMIELLLAAGANPNIRLRFAPPMRETGPDRGADGVLTIGATPLLRAAKGGDAAATALLLKAGARTDLATYNNWRNTGGGLTPLMVGAGIGYQLNDTRGKLRTQGQAIETVKLMLAAGADVNAKDDRGNTALHGAVFRGWNDMVKLLIENGADPYQPNNDGRTPLDAATSTDPAAFRGQVMTVDPGTAALIAQLKPRAR